MNSPLPATRLGVNFQQLQYNALFFLGLGAVATAIVVFMSAAIWGPEMAFPIDAGRSIGSKIDSAVDWATVNLDWFFDFVKVFVIKILISIENSLLWIPWPGLILLVCLIALRLGGAGLALMSFISLMGLGLVGLWPSAMETLALIATAVTLSIAIAIPVGVAAARSDGFDAVLRPILDGMQTMPSFVYLVPAIMFFSLGNVPAVMATIIYAVPPAIRLTSLGIRQVSPEVVDAARSFGTTPLQLLTKVQIPMAIPTIMAGINQTTMMALAMVVIASLVGAGGLGEDVNRALGRQEPGAALIGGASIVIMAIIIDRVTQGIVKKRQEALRGR